MASCNAKREKTGDDMTTVSTGGTGLVVAGDVSVVTNIVNVVDFRPRPNILFDLSPSSPRYYNRQVLLDELCSKVKKCQFKDQYLPTVSISGPPGVGKTELVRNYIRKYTEAYMNIIWIDAGSETSMTQSFMRLAGRLEIKTQNVDDTVRSQTDLMNDIYDNLCQSKTLIVFDNVDGDRYQTRDATIVKRFWPTSLHLRGDRKVPTILVTLRQEKLGYENEQTMAVPGFLTKESIMYVIQELQLELNNEENIKVTFDLVQLFSGLPFALNHAIGEIQKQQFFVWLKWDYRVRDLIKSYILGFQNEMKWSGVKTLTFYDLVVKYHDIIPPSNAVSFHYIFTLITKAETTIQNLTQNYVKAIEAKVKREPSIFPDQLDKFHATERVVAVATIGETKLDQNIIENRTNLNTFQIQVLQQKLDAQICSAYTPFSDLVRDKHDKLIQMATQEGMKEFEKLVTNVTTNPTMSSDEFRQLLEEAESGGMAKFLKVYKNPNPCPRTLYCFLHSIREKKQLLTDFERRKDEQVTSLMKKFEKKYTKILKQIIQTGHYIESSRFQNLAKQHKAATRASFAMELRRLELSKEQESAAHLKFNRDLTFAIDKLEKVRNDQKEIELEDDFEHKMSQAVASLEKELEEICKDSDHQPQPQLKTVEDTDNSKPGSSGLSDQRDPVQPTTLVTKVAEPTRRVSPGIFPVKKMNLVGPQFREQLYYLCKNTKNVTEFALKLRTLGAIDQETYKTIMGFEQHDGVKLLFMYKQVLQNNLIDPLLVALTFSGNDHIVEYMITKVNDHHGLATAPCDGGVVTKLVMDTIPVAKPKGPVPSVLES